MLPPSSPPHGLSAAGSSSDQAVEREEGEAGGGDRGKPRFFI